MTEVLSPWTPDRAWYRELLADQPGYRVDQVWQGLYRNDTAPTDQTNLPKALRAVLAERVAPALRPATERTADDGQTVKWLWELADHTRIETVLMHYRDRSTVCVSSQAGCAMGCGFCATGQAGYDRNLSVGEILEQVVAARRAAADHPDGPRRLSNIVFMGMGEPLANYNRLIECLHRLIADFEIGARHLTVSTVGLVPQMLRLAEEGLQVGLALSLHAANDDLRTELIPINARHPIDDLIAACQLFRERTGRRVSLEWAMIDGVNDRRSDAAELAAVALAAKAHVNLIPLNPTPGWPTVGTPPDRIDAFVDRLRSG
ncbi:MAG: 23S rRNA (adenine(2503)-C(2))-methyltransferase RlmN, partial [Actinomycetota bacterium]